MIKLNRFPGGKTKAFTASYDDGVTQDIRLTELFRKYGIKATFNLNSGLFEYKDSFNAEIPTTTVRISESQVETLYRGFEVASHTCTHSMMNLLSKSQQLQEILEDKKNLEKLVHYPVRGMALPYGANVKNIVETAEFCDIEYIRMTEEDRSMFLPDDYMNWKPTCHHAVPELMELGEKFLQPSMEEKYLHISGRPQLFYLWGHSYELDYEQGGNSWSSLEQFLQLISGKENIWYASNIEIVDYMKAVKALKISVAGNIIYNPSCLDIWITVDEEAVCIKSGTVYTI